MRNILVWLFLALAPFPALASAGPADQDETHTLASELAVCGGSFYALGETFKQSGKASVAQSMRDLGDSYTISGGWLLFISEKIPNLGKANAHVQTQALAEKTRVLSGIEKTADEKQKLADISALKAKAKTCNQSYSELNRQHAEGVRTYSSRK